jgi:hypothetical protein
MTEAIAVAAIAATRTVVVAGFGVIVAMLQRNHNAVNGRMTELLELTRQSSKAEGKVEGAKEEKEKTP